MAVSTPTILRVEHRHTSPLCRQLEDTVGTRFELHDISEFTLASDLGCLIGDAVGNDAVDDLHRQGWTILPAPNGQLVAVVQPDSRDQVAIGYVHSSDHELLSRLIRTTLKLTELQEAESRQQNELESAAHELSRQMEEQTWLRSLMQRMRLSDARVDTRSFSRQLLKSLRGLIHAESVALFEPLENHNSLREHFSSTWVGSRFADLDLWQQFLSEYSSGIKSHHVRICNAAAVDNRLRTCGVKSLLAVPVKSLTGNTSWLVGVNRNACDDPHRHHTEASDEFGTVEAGIVETAATLLNTHCQNVRLLSDQEDMSLGVIRSMSSAIDARDPYTQGHSERVGFYARHIAQILGLPTKQCERIYICGLLHDVGKIGVPDSVLRKPGKLTEEEFEMVKEHPQIGYDIVKNLPKLNDLLPGILHHHESMDGTGYPHGLSGEDIPLQARILAVADAFDAMTSDRTYREGMSYEKASEILREGAGTQWDVAVVNAFLQRDEA